MMIEDEFDLRDAVIEDLKTKGFDVTGLPDGQNFLQVILDFKPDVLLLDQLLPGKSGQEILKEIRANPKTSGLAILMLTGLNSEEQIVAALNLGADDYVTKPFSNKELSARITALARRAKGGSQAEQKQLAVKDLLIDLASYRVTLKGVELALTLTEFKILCELIRQSGQVLTRDRLRERALGNLNVSDRTIDVHMASLRKKLSDMGADIETVRGVGYRMAI
jgi:DNA-binding response OmpR family regulator